MIHPSVSAILCNIYKIYKKSQNLTNLHFKITFFLHHLELLFSLDLLEGMESLLYLYFFSNP